VLRRLRARPINLHNEETDVCEMLSFSWKLDVSNQTSLTERYCLVSDASTQQTI
jgi:hypothetical protein